MLTRVPNTENNYHGLLRAGHKRPGLPNIPSETIRQRQLRGHRAHHSRADSRQYNKQIPRTGVISRTLCRRVHVELSHNIGNEH